MIPLGEQLEVFDENAEAALEDIMSMLETSCELILETARDRMIEGFDVYGDEMWNWDRQTRHENIIEEIADAIVYQVSEYR